MRARYLSDKIGPMHLKNSRRLTFRISLPMISRGADRLSVNMPNQTTPASGISAEAHRFTYCPALDGLRAISVFMVLALHSNLTSGGFLGVDIFFVLSGFLITNILLNELQAEHRINLFQFYLRRARRLAPGLIALLLLAGLLWRSTMGHESFLGAAIPALFYYQNWALCFKTLGSVGI